MTGKWQTAFFSNLEDYKNVFENALSNQLNGKDAFHF